MFYIICKKARKAKRDAENKKKDPHFTIHSSATDLKDEGIILSDASHPMVSLSYFESLEKSNPLRMKFFYCIAWKSGNPVALYPLQIYTINLKTLDDFLDVNSFEPIQVLNGHASIIQKLLFTFKSELNVLVSGNAFITGNLHSIALNNSDLSYAHSLLPSMLEFAEIELSDYYKIHGVLVKDFVNDSKNYIAPSFENNYHKVNLDPCLKMNILSEWKDMDDYIEALSSKYRVRVNKAKERFGSLSSRILTNKEIDQYIKVIESLYFEMHNKATIRFSCLNETYFSLLANNLPSDIVFRGFFDNKNLVAFTVSIQNKSHFEAHLAGIDYSYNRKHSLYLNMLLSFIEDAITLESKSISFGRTATAIKSSIGAVPLEATCYLKINKPLNYAHLKPYLNTKTINEEPVRSPFKQTQEI